MQREWFAVSSSKLSTVVQVETMLTCVRDVSQSLLEHVVNMADNNVCLLHSLISCLLLASTLIHKCYDLCIASAACVVQVYTIHNHMLQLNGDS